MNEVEKVDQVSGEVMEANTSTALAQITGAEIDIQIATAHQYPRSMAQFKKRAMEMATLDEETAASCIYRRPVGKDQSGKQKFVEGKSIRMAEIVGASYGNLRVGAMLIDQNERFVVARGVAHDLESNFAASTEVIESTVDRYGKPFSERMRVVVAKAALAKARRDATFQVVPGAMCKSIESAAREVAFGKAKTMAERRSLVMEWMKLIGVEADRVFSSLGISGAEELGIEQLENLSGLRTAIKDGETTIDEAFPPIDDDAPADGKQAFGFKAGKAAAAPPPADAPADSPVAEPPAEEAAPATVAAPAPAPAPAPAAAPAPQADAEDADPTAEFCIAALAELNNIDQAQAATSLSHYSIYRFKKTFMTIGPMGYGKMMEAITDGKVPIKKNDPAA